ncbi:MAG: hypothetical protein SF123_14170 [Chloroflexota bacterium]|nr:hypothetical protein [Chloroflexota bacterium]
MSSAYFTTADCAALTQWASADTQLVYEKFLELHKALHRRFRDYTWDLHPHSDRNELICNRSSCSAEAIEGLTLRYSRSRDQALTVERAMRDGNRKLDMRLHPTLELRLTPNHFVVELIVSKEAWYDQQNLVGKLGVARHRQTLRSLIQSFSPDVCIGFWSGTELDEMHLKAGQVMRGRIFDEWISTFQDGVDDLRIGVWYDPQDSALDASQILTELTRRIEMLYKVYTFLSWTSNNDYQTFYEQAASYGSNRDMRLS